METFSTQNFQRYEQECRCPTFPFIFDRLMWFNACCLFYLLEELAHYIRHWKFPIFLTIYINELNYDLTDRLFSYELCIEKKKRFSKESCSHIQWFQLIRASGKIFKLIRNDVSWNLDIKWNLQWRLKRKLNSIQLNSEKIIFK